MEGQVQTASSGIRYLRTPDARFADLPDFPYEPHYLTNSDGLRVAYVDEGPRDGPVVLILEGQPSWSYGSRKLIGPLVEGGCRVISVDHIGMGRSDKVVDESLHSWEQHAHWTADFVEKLELREITLYLHDWGGNFGFVLVASRPHLFARVVAANAMLPQLPPQRLLQKLMGPVLPLTVDPEDTRDALQMEQTALQGGFLWRRVSKVLPAQVLHIAVFKGWMQWARQSAGFTPAAALKQGFLSSAPDLVLSEAELRAFDAPFPSDAYMAAPRTWPSMVPRAVQNGWVYDAGHGTKAMLERLRAFRRPFLTLCGDLDGASLGTKQNQDLLLSVIPGAKGMPHRRFPRGHHFIQEEHGAEIAQQVLSFMLATPKAMDESVGPEHELPPLQRELL